MHTAAPDGSSASLQHLIANLPRDEVEPFVVSPDGPVADALRRSGVTVVPLGGVSMLHSIVGMPLRGRRLIELGRTLVNLRHGPALHDAIEHLRPDVVHLNERGMLQAAVVARRTGAAVVILVFPSHHDGPGRSVIEAAIEGVPSVVALRHPVALAAAIMRLADDPALRACLGAAARTAAAERSDPKVVARRVVEIYREALLSRGTGSTRRPTPS